jgi:hypothetical protein
MPKMYHLEATIFTASIPRAKMLPCAMHGGH